MHHNVCQALNHKGCVMLIAPAAGFLLGQEGAKLSQQLSFDVVRYRRPAVRLNFIHQVCHSNVINAFCLGNLCSIMWRVCQETDETVEVTLHAPCVVAYLCNAVSRPLANRTL